MEVLFEYKGSRRQLTVAEREGVTRVVSSELRRLGRSRAQVFTANDELPTATGRRGQAALPDIYLLQKWSQQWDCYVDVNHCNEVTDGDRLAVIAKPKPPSKFSLLCCCGSSSSDSYRAGKVGGSGRNKLPKTEEIQCLEYKFRTDSQADSGWEDEPPEASPADQQPDTEEEGVFIRAETGRAGWKLINSKDPVASSTPDQHTDPPTGTPDRQPEAATAVEGSGDMSAGGGAEGGAEGGGGAGLGDSAGEQAAGEGEVREGEGENDTQEVGGEKEDAEAGQEEEAVGGDPEVAREEVEETEEVGEGGGNQEEEGKEVGEEGKEVGEEGAHEEVGAEGNVDEEGKVEEVGEEGKGEDKGEEGVAEGVGEERGKEDVGRGEERVPEGQEGEGGHEERVSEGGQVNTEETSADMAAATQQEELDPASHETETDTT